MAQPRLLTSVSSLGGGGVSLAGVRLTREKRYGEYAGRALHVYQVGSGYMNN